MAVSFLFLIVVALIGLLVLGGFVALVVFLLSRPKTRAIGAVLLVVPVALVLIGVVVALFVTMPVGIHEVHQEAARVEMEEAREVAMRRMRLEEAQAMAADSADAVESPVSDAGETVKVADSDELVARPSAVKTDAAASEPVRSGNVLRAVGGALARAADKAKQRKKEDAAATEEASAPELAVTETASTAPAPPDWVGSGPGRVGGTYQMTVEAGPYATREECDEKLDAELQQAVDRYVATYLGPRAVGAVELPMAEIRHEIVQAEWLERPHSQLLKRDMYKLHVLLAFDRTVNERLREKWDDVVVTERLGGVAVLGVLLLSVLGVAYGYLKTDLATGGAYRGRLRAAALAVVVVLVGGLVLLVQL